MRSHCMVFLSGFFNSAYLFGITQIRLLQHVSIVRPFSWHSSRPLYGYTVFVYQFTCWWTFRLFPCWGCCERTFQYKSSVSLGCVFICLGEIPRHEVADHMVVVCLTFQETASASHKVAFLPAVYEFQFLCLPTVGMFSQ